MTNNELKSFLMVYEYRSYSIAAKRLFVSQSAISKRIGNLEHEMGAKLFEIRGNLLFPTHEAKLLVPYARQLINTLNNAVADLMNPDFSKIEILLGTTLYPSVGFIPFFMEFLTKAKTGYPHLRIKQIAKQDLYTFLLNGFIDVAMTTEDMEIESSIKCTVIDEEDIFIVISPQHILAKEKEVSLKDLANFPCVLTPPGFSIRDRLERRFSKLELPFLLEHELYSFEALKKLVRLGIGWSALPKQYFDDELIRLNVSDFSEKIKLSWYCHKERFDSKIIQYTASLFKQFIA
ncbi:LysR family transcriptional regulator [Legionella maceachernii]|uniref:LysR family transcriptional regulator n=1 Tax=Legionella maceachernii TaxID=466 RepID=A0A0W0W0X9_9GAMM|nr:LysR family transcriptional regulator [Legionella maceachernii]KTD26028.1 LysR family transcriptional regulator [Legionella maceachernii]SJZ50982.1 DNA-binding transcriptional regulator, LysR family [Legionella maceachernii]SUP03714.1 HTH-type transcriptional regulator gltC [Legionella maceachernii]